MKIKYSKQRMNSNRKGGVYFIIIGVLMTIGFSIFNETNKFVLDTAGMGLIVAGIFTLAVYYYEEKKQYLTIENGILKKNTLFSKEIKLNEIQSIKKFARDYILITAHSELTIQTGNISASSLLVLNQELDKLNLRWK